MSSPNATHVPAPPPKRITGRRLGGMTDGPKNNANDQRQNEKLWESAATQEHTLANNLLAEAALIRKHNSETVTRTRKEAESQSQVVADNLAKKLKLLKSVRQKLITAERKLINATDCLVTAERRAGQLHEKLQKPLKKCVARAQLRVKRPPTERITDDVSHAVQTQADGIVDALQKLETLRIGAIQQRDENLRHAQLLRNDADLKTAAIDIEEQCVALGQTRLTNLGGPEASQPPVMHPSSARNANNTSIESVTLTHEAPVHARGAAGGSPSEWQQRTAGLLEKSQQLLDHTTDHTGRINTCIVKATGTHKSMNATTHTALEAKTALIAKQEAKFQADLEHLSEEMEVLRHQHEAIGIDVQRRQEPLLLAKKRLDARRERPNGEKVRDSVEEELEKEFATLASGIENLTRQQHRVQEEMDRLRSVHAKLKVSLNCKQSALSLDRECLQLDAQSEFNMSSRASSVRSSRASAHSGIAPAPGLATFKREVGYSPRDYGTGSNASSSGGSGFLPLVKAGRSMSTSR